MVYSLIPIVYFLTLNWILIHGVKSSPLIHRVAQGLFIAFDT